MKWVRDQRAYFSFVDIEASEYWVIDRDGAVWVIGYAFEHELDQEYLDFLVTEYRTLKEAKEAIRTFLKSIDYRRPSVSTCCVGERSGRSAKCG